MGSMKNKFVLKAKRLPYVEEDSRPVVKISAESYNLLVDMANESGMPLSKIASKAINYAAKNVIYERSEE